MVDYISREAALDFHIPTYDLNISAQDQRILGDRLEEFLESIPAADVRSVVRGKWRNARPSSPMLDGGGPPYCSVCGEEAPLRSAEKNQWKLVGGRISGPEVVYSEETYFSNFCPNCGANMMEETNA